ncbi:hypothetical protein [Photobacterium damselae]|uniref:hypothetical protein n=1 Tax=Photobacterium damselae TaxID=38293 RepID=UPI00165E1E32|nr:hypothetical protein [Photobacterium damselae]
MHKEFALSEILNQLWKNKKVNILIILFLCIASLSINQLTKNSWSYSFSFNKPTASYLLPLDNQVNKINRLYERNGIEKPFDKSFFRSEAVFNNFIDLAESLNVKEEFFKAHPELLKIIVTGNMDDEIADLNINKSIKINKDTSSLEVLLPVKNVKKYANDYIDFVNEKVIKNTNAIFNEKYVQLESYVKNSIYHREQQIKNKIESKIAYGKIELDVLDKAGIKKPLENYNNTNSNEIFNINMGSNALSAELNVLNKINKKSLIDNDNMHLNLSAMLKFISEQSIRENTYFKSYSIANESIITKSNKLSNVIVILLSFIISIIVCLFYSIYTLSTSKDK